MDWQIVVSSQWNERSCMNKALQVKTTQLLFDVVCDVEESRTKDMCYDRWDGNETTPDLGLCKRRRALTGGTTPLWMSRAMPTGAGSLVSSSLRSL